MRKENVDWVIAILILLVATMISCLSSNWGWLSRAGSIVVAYALFVGVRSVLNEKFDAVMEDSNATKNANEFISKTNNPLEQKIHMVHIYAKSLFRLHASQQKIVVHSARLALLGALFWGFGDLPNEFGF